MFQQIRVPKKLNIAIGRVLKRFAKSCLCPGGPVTTLGEVFRCPNWRRGLGLLWASWPSLTRSPIALRPSLGGWPSLVRWPRLVIWPILVGWPIASWPILAGSNFLTKSCSNPRLCSTGWSWPTTHLWKTICYPNIECRMMAGGLLSLFFSRLPSPVLKVSFPCRIVTFNPLDINCHLCLKDCTNKSITIQPLTYSKVGMVGHLKIMKKVDCLVVLNRQSDLYLFQNIELKTFRNFLKTFWWPKNPEIIQKLFWFYPITRRHTSLETEVDVGWS